MRKLFLISALSCILCACQPSTPELAPGEELVDANEANISEQMVTALKHYALSQTVQGTMPRFNQVKTHACLNGVFVVNDNLPEEFQQGLFQPGARYRVTARFANAKQMDDREKDFRGLSLKLTGTPGEALWGQAGVTDFLLNSYPQLFAATPEHFLAFIDASVEGSPWQYLISPGHWYSLPILMKGRQKINSVLEINYYSTTPYRLGASTDQAVKYSVSPCGSRPVMGFDARDQDFLSANIERHLQKQTACFRFGLQLQRGAMPIENAAALWSERDSPFRPVATLLFANQAIFGEELFQHCENMRFNPWQTSGDHQPLGGINRVRRVVYAEMGDFRLDYNKNHQP